MSLLHGCVEVRAFCGLFLCFCQHWSQIWLQGAKSEAKSFHPPKKDICILKRQNFRLVQIKIIRQKKWELKIEICSGRGRKYCGTWIKCCLPAFSFTTMFSECIQFIQRKLYGNFLITVIAIISYSILMQCSEQVLNPKCQ